MKEGWKYMKLGEIATTINGLWKGKKEPFVNVGVIRNTNFTKDITLDFSKIEYLNVEEKQYQKRKLQKGDLIVEKSGGSEKQPVGRTVLFNAEGEFSVSNFTSILRINNQNEITPEFLYKYLLYIYREGWTKEMQNATTGIHNIIFEKFLAISIPVPPLSDQQRIVSYLDAEFANIEALKANAEKQLQAAKDLFQAALKELLTPKEGWKMKTIDSLQTDMYRGSGITREQIRLEGVPCVRYGEIYTTYNYWFEECVSHTDEQIINSKKYFEHGDILFAITGESVEDIGKSIAYLGHNKCLAGGDIIVMKHNQNPKYLAYALSTPDAIAQKGFGKTKLKVVHTNAPSLKAIVLPIPSLSEQQRIADRLDALSANVKALQSNYTETITLCNDLKQALLKKVFE